MSLESILNPIGVGLLLSSLYMLRFRAWRRPVMVVAYFAFFTSLEWVAAQYFMPPGALPNEVGYVCLGLTLPILVATILVWRREQREREGD